MSQPRLGQVTCLWPSAKTVAAGGETGRILSVQVSLPFPSRLLHFSSPRSGSRGGLKEGLFTSCSLQVGQLPACCRLQCELELVLLVAALGPPAEIKKLHARSLAHFESTPDCCAKDGRVGKPKVPCLR